MKNILLASVSIIFYSSVESQQLILPGDYPDPSVVKIGDTYWASATTSNWGPVYPLLKSKDLLNWKTASYVFIKQPSWADYYFWAPEISYDKGKVYVYYAAHKKGGNLCLGVASADKPEGPYTDHGPLMCQEVGSIDAFPMRDENGKLYMIWKEDANSVRKPTPIWIMEMNEERTKLIGEKKELFRNDAAWEGNLVEGVSMIRNGEYFYAFYAAAGCCGAGCTYQTGVARSKSLFGPWEKYAKNPILSNDEEWICPGHGTPIEKNGKYYFMYHAYDKSSNVYTGREGLLREFTFTSDGWIEFVPKEISNSNQVKAQKNGYVNDRFRGKKLSDKWQWSVFQQPACSVKGGELYLTAMPVSTGSFLGHKIVSGNFSATTKVHLKKSNATTGIAVIGDDNNMIAAMYSGDTMKIVKIKDGKEEVVVSRMLPRSKKMTLTVRVANGKDIDFYYEDKHLLLNDVPLDGSYLPPWDRAIRVGLISKGAQGTRAVYDNFELANMFN
jgi:xylan 1,4-beta-xylosidase